MKGTNLKLPPSQITLLPASSQCFEHMCMLSKHGFKRENKVLMITWVLAALGLFL